MNSFGPHWPFSIAMFICILSIGGFFIFAVCRELTWPHYLAGWVCMLTTLYLFWSVLVQECGVLTPFDYQPYQIAPELNREFYYPAAKPQVCGLCKAKQTVGSMHCDVCDV